MRANVVIESGFESVRYHIVMCISCVECVYCVRCAFWQRKGGDEDDCLEGARKM